MAAQEAVISREGQVTREQQEREIPDRTDA